MLLRLFVGINAAAFVRVVYDIFNVLKYRHDRCQYIRYGLEGCVRVFRDAQTRNCDLHNSKSSNMILKCAH